MRRTGQGRADSIERWVDDRKKARSSTPDMQDKGDAAPAVECRRRIARADGISKRTACRYALSRLGQVDRIGWTN